MLEFSDPIDLEFWSRVWLCLPAPVELTLSKLTSRFWSPFWIEAFFGHCSDLCLNFRNCNLESGCCTHFSSHIVACPISWVMIGYTSPYRLYVHFKLELGSLDIYILNLMTILVFVSIKFVRFSHSPRPQTPPSG